jgi:hypothetical protein
MADVDFNPEKEAGTMAAGAAFSPSQTEGFATAKPMKLADSSSTAHVLPLFVICPDGTVAGSATTRQEMIKLNLSCHGKS